MISVSAKVLYQVREKSEEMKIEKVYFFTPQFDARNKKDKIDEKSPCRTFLKILCNFQKLLQQKNYQKLRTELKSTYIFF